jgi:hypothetical protein
MSETNLTRPAAVTWLGYGGLLPFIALALLILVDPAHALLWSDALVGYGAVILSFVGALHWGFAMMAPGLDASLRRNAFVWSVFPALIAWPAVLLTSTLASLILVGGFLLHLLQDLRLAIPAQLPAWYLPLRKQLTLVACVCLLSNAWVGF